MHPDYAQHTDPDDILNRIKKWPCYELVKWRSYVLNFYKRNKQIAKGKFTMDRLYLYSKQYNLTWEQVFELAWYRISDDWKPDVDARLIRALQSGIEICYFNNVEEQLVVSGF